MRIAFTIIFFCLILALLYCAHVARRSGKPISTAVMHMLLALVPPVIGNLILIISTNQTLSTIGCYIYFLGMDLVMLALVQFTAAYCYLSWPKVYKYAIYGLLGIDAAQLLVNIFTGHAFTMERIMAYGAPYYRLVPLYGQTFHRVVDYGILLGVIIVFIVKTVRSPRINAERYSVILASIIVGALWQTLYIFSRAPVDRSMIGFGVFGLLIFYFSLYYRPLRLLDRMLATVASEIPDALFFFDVGGNCIWANKRGIDLLGIKEGEYDTVTERLGRMLGDTGAEDDSWSGQQTVGTGDSAESYAMERRKVTDEKARDVGSFLTVRDNTDEQKLLQKEIYNATHDGLTQVYNRSGYDLLVSRLDMAETMMLLIDVDYFKQVNDQYGHEIGDQVLKKIARVFKRHFRSDDHICRYGGDEFVVLMQRTDDMQFDRIRERIRGINSVLSDTADGLPPVTISVGAANGDSSTHARDLFDRADKALYETKRNGRNGITFFGQLSAAP